MQQKENWKTKYEELLREFRIDDACDLAQKQRPSSVYKFFDLSGKKDTDIVNIIKGSIRFNTPLAFNDPFDSSWYYDCKKYRQSDDVYILLRDEVSKPSIRILNNRGICNCACFTEQYNSVLMWAHYAGGHTGICVEYDAKKLTDKGHILMPIVYTDDIFCADRLLGKIQDKKELIYPALFKSKCWEYEREWRLFDISSKQCGKLDSVNNLIFTNAVLGVYFGALEQKNMSDTNFKEVVLRHLKKNSKFVANMKVSKEKFKLEVKYL